MIPVIYKEITSVKQAQNEIKGYELLSWMGSKSSEVTVTLQNKNEKIVKQLHFTSKRLKSEFIKKIREMI